MRSAPPVDNNEAGLYWFKEVPNLGDLLSPVILGWFLRRKIVWSPPDHQGKFLSTGSVIETLSTGDIVWGTGSKFPETVDPVDARVLAVRGPRTLDSLGLKKRDIAFGDPAVLMPAIYAVPKTQARSFRVGLIPHYVDQDIMRRTSEDDIEIDVTDRDWKATIRRIAACSMVVSSSLHGIIIAETYGVPAVWVQPSNRIFGGHHKFLDYYESTGRLGKCHPWEAGLTENLRDTEGPPDFSSMRNELLRALGDL